MDKQISRLFVLACFTVASGWGGVISFGSDLLSESNNITGTNVVITAHPAWGNLPPYSWISYRNTGYATGASSPPNASIPGTPTAIFTEWLPAFSNAVNVTVFADDTAAVYLFDNANPTGLLLKGPNPLQDSACAAGPIGCQPNESWTSGWVPVALGGTAWLEIHAYQRGGGPFGVLYGGEAHVVPEPGTYALLGLGLIFLGLLQPFFCSRNRSRIPPIAE